MLRIRNILRYAVAIALNIFVMVVFHSYVNLVLLAGLLLFPLYSIYGVHKVKSHLSVTLQAPTEDMHKGEEFLVRIVLENPTWFPLVNVTAYVKVGNSFYGVQGEHELNMPLRAHGKTETVYTVVMEESGHFTFRFCMHCQSFCIVIWGILPFLQCLYLQSIRFGFMRIPACMWLSIQYYSGRRRFLICLV